MSSATTTPESDLLEPKGLMVVATGEVGGFGEPAMAGDGPDPCSSGSTRIRKGALGATMAVFAISVAGWFWWQWSHQSSTREHWDAVARGRQFLNRGRPDLALQAVNAVRDEGPGSGEAMTVAGLALMRLGEFRGARLALERTLKLTTETVRCGHNPGRIELRPGKRPATEE